MNSPLKTAFSLVTAAAAVSADCSVTATSALFEQVYAALPQTQCTRCGYPDCAAYAQAISAGLAAINQCPPGGEEGVLRLARITGRPALPLNPANGVEGTRSVAIIDEEWCIGCTLCIKACPTDAILGSNKLMHTVIEPYCTGCGLCIPVCPVDCINLENITGKRTGWSAWSEAEADQARTRYEFHGKLYGVHGGNGSGSGSDGGHEHQEAADRQAAAPVSAARAQDDPAVADKKRAVIEAALARAREKRKPPA